MPYPAHARPMTPKEIRDTANLDEAAKVLREEFEAAESNARDLHDLWYWRVASVVIATAYPNLKE